MEFLARVGRSLEFVMTLFEKHRLAQRLAHILVDLFVLWHLSTTLIRPPVPETPPQSRPEAPLKDSARKSEPTVFPIYRSGAAGEIKPAQPGENSNRREI